MFVLWRWMYVLKFYKFQLSKTIDISAKRLCIFKKSNTNLSRGLLVCVYLSRTLNCYVSFAGSFSFFLLFWALSSRERHTHTYESHRRRLSFVYSLLRSSLSLLKTQSVFCLMLLLLLVWAHVRVEEKEFTDYSSNIQPCVCTIPIYLSQLLKRISIWCSYQNYYLNWGFRIDISSKSVYNPTMNLAYKIEGVPV